MKDFGTLIIMTLGALFGLLMVAAGFLAAIAFKAAVLVGVCYCLYWGVDTFIIQDMEKPVAEYVGEVVDKVQTDYEKGVTLDSIATKEIK